jgi:hypothetical protein
MDLAKTPFYINPALRMLRPYEWPRGENMFLKEENPIAQDSRVVRTNSTALVVSLQICPAHRAPMQKRETVRALENLGLEGDRHAVPDGSRQVLLIEEETLDRLAIPIGAVKENITTRGIELMHLAQGTRLQIGGVVFELTKACDPCSRMDEIRMGLQEELEGQRGMLARVLRGGEVRVGDEIKIAGYAGGRMVE